MFNKFSLVLSLFKNFDKVTNVIQTIYDTVIKLYSCLVFIQSEITNTKLGKTLEKYLPICIDILDKVKTIIEKYGHLVNLNVETSAQSINISEESLEDELKKSLNKLNELSK